MFTFMTSLVSKLLQLAQARPTMPAFTSSIIIMVFLSPSQSHTTSTTVTDPAHMWPMASPSPSSMAQGASPASSVRTL